MSAEVLLFLSWKWFYLYPTWQAKRNPQTGNPLLAWLRKRKQLYLTALGASPLCLSRSFPGRINTDHVSSSEQSLPQGEEDIGEKHHSNLRAFKKIKFKSHLLSHLNGWLCVVSLHPYVLSHFPHPCGSNRWKHRCLLAENGTQWPAFNPKFIHLFTHITPLVVCIPSNEQMAFPPQQCHCSYMWLHEISCLGQPSHWESTRRQNCSQSSSPKSVKRLFALAGRQTSAMLSDTTAYVALSSLVHVSSDSPAAAHR